MSHWISGEVLAPETARLMAALEARRAQMLARFPNVPVQRRGESPDAGQPLLTAGALLTLWSRWPAMTGACPECGGAVRGTNFNGLLSRADVFGVCLSCTRALRSPFMGGVAQVLHTANEYLRGTPFRCGSPWGRLDPEPYAELRAALAILETSDGQATGIAVSVAWQGSGALASPEPVGPPPSEPSPPHTPDQTTHRPTIAEVFGLASPSAVESPLAESDAPTDRLAAQLSDEECEALRAAVCRAGREKTLSYTTACRRRLGPLLAGAAARLPGVDPADARQWIRNMHDDSVAIVCEACLATDPGVRPREADDNEYLREEIARALSLG